MKHINPVRSSFATDVLKLVTGTTGAQLITILASPILTRLYGPEAFGFLTLFTSITGIVGLIACLRYELAIVLPKEEREAVNLLALCILLTILISALSVPIFYFGSVLIASWLQSPGLAPYLLLVPLFVFINGVFIALNRWNTRTKHFGRLSIAKITSAVTATIGQLGAGFAGFATGGSLIGAYVGGTALSTIVLGGQILRDDHQRFRNTVALSTITEMMRRYKKFPLYDTFSALVNALSWQAPVLLLASFFSPAIVGYYALGFRILHVPMNLVGAAITQVFFQRAAEAHQSGNLAPLVRNILTILLKIVIFPMLVLTVAGADLFAFVFGANWGEAGLYIQILSIWGIFWFISSPLSLIYVVQENQRFGLIFNSISLVTRFLSILIGGLVGNVFIALGIFSISGIVVYGVFCYLLIEMAGVSFRETTRIFFKILTFTLPFLGTLLIGQLLTDDSMYITIMAFLIGIIYYFVLLKTDPQIKKLVPFG